MKITVVPAQVTTVEDKIMGSLSLSQLMILLLPVFIGAALFAILPPAMGSALYKYILIGILSVICLVLSIRIKGKIVALWIVTILRYNLRPKYYLFNKNVTTLRADYAEVKQTDIKAEKSKKESKVHIPRLGTLETARVLATIDNPASNLRFETTKKGGLHVRLTEVEE
jgi:hypothetical protein